MDPVRSRHIDGANFLGQTSEIRRQERGRDDDRPMRRAVRLGSAGTQGVRPRFDAVAWISITAPAFSVLLRLVSNRHAVSIEFVILVIATLAGAEVREIVDELDRRDPLDHLEPELVFTAQP
jgi:hypothetical protein